MPYNDGMRTTSSRSCGRGAWILAVLLTVTGCPTPGAATVIFDGAARFQPIEGFGVNANHRSWNGDELKPVIDSLLDAGLGLFRVVFDNADWEATNDNTNAAVFKWSAYNAIYDSGDFRKLWDFLAYLNQHGVSNGICLSIMGPGPGWMGGATLTAGQEDEWAETIASMLVYARRTRGLKFTLVSPNNEADIYSEGIHMGAAQYVKCLRKLARRLDAEGLSDIRFVAPDLAGTRFDYLTALAGDATVMAKLAHFGVHGYSEGAGSGGMTDFIQSSGYPARTFWQTEFNVWLDGADSGTRGVYDWAYCRGTAVYLLSHLANGASAGLVWEGYDSYYRHPPSAWSFWGLFSVDNENAAVKSYTARKNFHTVSQISRFVKPGARRLGVEGAGDPFSPLLAFYQEGTGQITLTGLQNSGAPALLEGRLKDLPAVRELTLTFTTAATNLAEGGSTVVTGGVFSVWIPADCVFTLTGFAESGPAEWLGYHPVKVDANDLILPWSVPASRAFDRYLDRGWAWALAAPLDEHGLPISFLYCAWNPGNPPTASASWENDVGEKIPNWVESARLYYQYAGDKAPLDQVKQLVDYALAHGQTPAGHAWPRFPVGTANAGDTEFRGFTGAWDRWDCHVDLAADMGWAFYTMFKLYGDSACRDEAVRVADLLADHQQPGTATESPWPYVVNSKSGAVKSRYAASWDGALRLFDALIADRQGRVSDYKKARAALRRWLLAFPMQNGNWVDGHSDVHIDGTDNLSATCAGDMALYLLEHPRWDPDFLTDVPRLMKWTEDHFVDVATPDGLAGRYHGAAVPAEQTAYMYRMGYQAARLGAQYARWYAATGDATFKDKAYRCLVYNTYMMQNNGQSSDGPTSSVGYWWSDCYGEAPRMYYYGLAAVPEWAPPDENHLVQASSLVRSIQYGVDAIRYVTCDNAGTEVLRLAVPPTNVLSGGVPLPRRDDLEQAGWTYNPGDGVLRIRHDETNRVRVLLDVSRIPTNVPPTPDVPVLGSAGDGAFTDTLWDGGAWINACRFKARLGQSVTRIRAKVGAVSGHYRCAIYADSGSGPGALAGRTAELTAPGTGWQELPLKAPLELVKGRYYWLAIWSDDPAARIYADNGGTTRWARQDYGAWPDPLATTGAGGYRYSIYALPAP